MTGGWVAFRTTLPGEAATWAFGGRLATHLRPGDVVGLIGDLGAGKSVLARAVLNHLAGAPIEVPSPTFTLVQEYDFPDLRVLHADLYRLERSDDVWELGLADALDDAALLIEWADKLPTAWPTRPLRIHLTVVDQAQRLAEIIAPTSWRDRIRHFGG